MKRILGWIAVFGILLGAGTLSSFAGANGQASTPAQAAAPAAAKSDNRQAFLDDLKDMEEKMVGLAEAFPQDKYTWRPGEGVRSVSEVFLHLASGYFGFPTLWGVPPPAGFEFKGFDKSTTDKAKIIQQLKQSYAHMREAVEKIPDADLDKPVNFFGTKTTVNGVLFLIAAHLHEHLGQAIAYARINGVVPPWTAAREAKQAAPKK
jgi:uncharacterized damage-inducible protein DinB